MDYEKRISKESNICKVATDEESLLITYFKDDNKFNTLVYNNINLLHYDIVCFN